MKKLKQAWIISDSVIGHEVQSTSLGLNISDTIKLFHCGLRQPWLSFAPRILPGFGRNIIWEKAHLPNFDRRADVIITAGRRMAAIGKYIKSKYNIRHIQILNPKDNPSNYDILICPEHDKVHSDNVIHSIGGLHHYNQEKLQNLRDQWQSKIKPNKQHTLSLLIGNPSKEFFNGLQKLKLDIKRIFNHSQLLISASRRTEEKYKEKIKETFSEALLTWFSNEDGKNPYPGMLSCSDVFMVTADSINMITETCATDKPVIILGENLVSPKHKRFIKSLKDRVCFIENPELKKHRPIYSMEDVSKKVLLKLEQMS